MKLRQNHSKLKFGKAFLDELSKVKSSLPHKHQKTDASSWQDNLLGFGEEAESSNILSEWKQIAAMVIIVVSLFGIFVRLFHLQITEGDRNRVLADSNRIAIKTIHAPRGVIYDRSGKILAQNEPGFRIPTASSSGKTEYLTRDDVLALEVKNDPRLKDLEIDNLRSYPYGEEVSHVLGYIGEITQEELVDPKYNDYKLGDRIGRGGVEQIYEKVLKGIDGGEIIEIDAQGNKLRTLGKTESIPGQNIYLSIDIDLQKKTYDLLAAELQKSKSCCGAAIIQDPNTGEILTLISIPSFNQNKIQEYFQNPNSDSSRSNRDSIGANSPFLNRAISGMYPPGSTFKIATALSALESGKITADTKIEDTGVVNLGPYQFTNWYFTQYGQKEAGLVDVIRALQRSNDTFFYILAQRTGEEIMGEFAVKLGFNQTLGIDLPGEEEGVIPNNQWKVEKIGEIWFPGDSLHMSIGQGFVLATPLQISNLTSIIAANGHQYPPHTVLKITDPDNKTIKQYKYDSFDTKLKPENIRLIQQGLELVPKNGGTAWPLFNFPIDTAGKTGTAEFGDPKNRTHAWYTGYAPLNNPKIVATVLLESGGEGSTNASPVVKEIFRYFFSPDKNNLIKDLVPLPAATSSARPVGD